ncbi:hypothetical protein SAMN05444146_0581 [Flavobacterium johnsoniae]|nr:hypothetical protein SAMN05444146_0581 [Flavobacterium johnsoniae]
MESSKFLKIIRLCVLASVALYVLGYFIGYLSKMLF